MDSIESKLNAVVNKLNQRTQEGRLRWTSEPAVLTIQMAVNGMTPVQYAVTHQGKDFVLSGVVPAGPSAVMKATRKDPNDIKLAIREPTGAVSFTFPPFPSIDDLFVTVRQRVDVGHLDEFFDGFLKGG